MAEDPLIAAIRNRRARELVETARDAASNAHALYSQFCVGAAVMTATATYVGCNVENRSYGLTICAERNAVARAVASEGSDMKLVAVGLYAHSVRGGQLHTVSPCGACRQVLAEFDPRDRSAAITFLRHGAYATTTVAKLLPDPFEFTPPRPAVGRLTTRASRAPGRQLQGPSAASSAASPRLTTTDSPI